MNNKNIFLVSLAVVLSACSIGTSINLPTVFGGYTMSSIDADSPSANGCHNYSWDLYYPQNNYIYCDKESSTVELYFGFQNVSPSFFIDTPQTNEMNGINVVNIPVNYNGFNPNCANSPSQTGDNYNCSTIISAQNAESGNLYFTIVGGGGTTQIFKVIYQ